MSRRFLEHHQIWIYVACVLLGLGLGRTTPPLFETLAAVTWPVLGLLLYVTFTQVPLVQVPHAFQDRQFMGAVLIGNFLIIPLVVGFLLNFLPAEQPALRLGVLLVLLVPCTDWYITFTHLCGGDTRRAIAVTPVNLFMQLGLMPFYLWIFMGNAFWELWSAEQITLVIVSLILLPLGAAWITERWAERFQKGASFINHLSGFQVPLLGAVIFLIAASQAETAFQALPVLPHVLGIFIAFLFVAAGIGTALARSMQLSSGSARALIFSLGTRNSFVVLPLALALDSPWETATVVIVFQSLVELFGMVAYLWIVPRYLAR
ncbi:MAG: arsenic resistance protein [Candidatus Methylacidiphilales bacterium]